MSLENFRWMCGKVRTLLLKSDRRRKHFSKSLKRIWEMLSCNWEGAMLGTGRCSSSLITLYWKRAWLLADAGNMRAEALYTFYVSASFLDWLSAVLWFCVVLRGGCFFWFVFQVNQLGTLCLLWLCSNPKDCHGCHHERSNGSKKRCC